MRAPVIAPLDALLTMPEGTTAVRARPARLAPAVARRILAGGAMAGMIGAALFGQEMTGLGLVLYLLVLAAGVGGLSRASIRALPPRVLSLLVASALFALLSLVRASEVLTVVNAMASLFFVTLASALAKPGATLALTDARVRELLALVPTGVVEAISGAPRFLFGDARAAFVGADGSSRSAAIIAVTRALMLALALVVVFAVLLSGGDPVFRQLVSWPASWDALRLPEYLFRFCLCACPALAITWSTTRPAEPRADLLADGITLNRLDVLTALVSLNALFAVYLLLQLRVLFGGSAYVLATTGLTLAQYARGGFFALTFAAALVLGVLLGLNALLREDRLGAWPVARRLSTSLLGMVGLMLVSATTRMLLYVQTFGITIDRIVALAVMAWLAMTGVWFLLTVLRERSSFFVIGAVVTGSVTLFALNVINPEAIVVRSAVAQSARGGVFDTEYMLKELRSDAVPALVQALKDGMVPPHDAAQSCFIATELLTRWNTPSANPVSSWTVSEARAAWTVSRNRTLLAEQCAPR
jgi:hypothetical protein